MQSLYCKNERAIITCEDSQQRIFYMVPVAAVLVASLKLHWIDDSLNLNYKGATEIASNHEVKKGQELGWFEHGSTIIMLYPPEVQLGEQLQTGRHIRMGEPLIAR